MLLTALGALLVWPVLGGRSGIAGILRGAVGSFVESTVGWSDCWDANASSGSGALGRADAAGVGIGANGTLSKAAGGSGEESDDSGGGEAVGLGAADGTEGARAAASNW